MANKNDNKSMFLYTALIFIVAVLLIIFSFLGQLKSDNESLTQKQSQNDLLLSANGYFTLGNNSMALETLDKVNYNDLSSDQKIIYDNIKNNIN